MTVEDFRGDFNERMAKLQSLLKTNESAIIVGSSFGDLMAAVFACKNPEKVRRLILLAPPLSWYDFSSHILHKLRLPVIIYHGRHDDVVPVEPVHRMAHRIFANLSFHTLDDDHLLSRHFLGLDWPKLLGTGLQTG